MNKGDDYLQGQDDLGIQESGLREEISLDGIVKIRRKRKKRSCLTSLWRELFTSQKFSVFGKTT